MTAIQCYNITLISIVCVDPELYDLNLICHFIKHYRSLGIDDFIIMINANREEDIKSGEKIFKELGIVPFIWLGEFSEIEKTEKLRNMQLNAKTKWVMIVDSDEFVMIEASEIKNTLQDIYGYVRGVLVDRVAESGYFEPVNPNVPIWSQFPVEKKLTSDIAKGCDRKIFLFNKDRYTLSKGSHRIIPHRISGHDLPPHLVRCFPKIYDIAHFKWTKTIKNRISKRLDWDVYWVDEYHRTLKYIEETCKC